MARNARFGSISSGTLRSEDLLSAFVDELRVIRGALPKDLYKALRAVHTSNDYGSDNAHTLVNDLADALNELAPAYGYFGAHEGDGSDFGFWLPAGWDDDFDGLRVADISEIPRDYTGEVLHVSDHGNPTLYWADAANTSIDYPRLTEMWSLV